MIYRVGKKFGYLCGMRRRLLRVSVLASLLFAPALTAAQEPATQGEQPTFRSGAERVTVGATVRDQRGRLITNLRVEDFEVIDGGLRRAISEFQSEAAPVSVAILFDISGSMRIGDRNVAARFAAHHVMSWLQEGRDEAALFTFDSRLHEVAPFTVDTRTLQGALGEVDSFGATSLHDAIAATARQIGERSGRRRAVVVLTDGIDTASRLTPTEVSGIASAIDVPVYIIATVLALDNPELNERAEHTAEVPREIGTIRDLATWTGGTLFYASSPAETSRVSRLVIDELRHQYLIAFEPGAGYGWRPLEIRTPKKDYVVRARSGYMAGGARPITGW
jgi:Ca-activated chloride channel family protein